MEKPVVDAREERDRVAAEWAVALEAGPVGTVRQAELDRWLGDDPLHRGALIRARAALALLTHSPEALPAKAPRPGRRALLACGAACILAGGIFSFRSTPSLVTGTGEIRQTPLADGSNVTLDTATSLKPHFSSSGRDMRLDQGRALFRVAHDPGRPFVVEAAGIRVRAVGTVFSVARTDAIEVLVAEGIVEVTGGSRGVMLKAGERGRFLPGQAAMTEQVPAEALARALDWRDGRLELQGQTLASAVATINRYNHRPIVVADRALAEEPLHGVFRNDDPEGFARAAALGLGARSWVASDRIVIGR